VNLPFNTNHFYNIKVPVGEETPKYVFEIDLLSSPVGHCPFLSEAFASH